MELLVVYYVNNCLAQGLTSSCKTIFLFTILHLFLRKKTIQYICLFHVINSFSMCLSRTMVYFWPLFLAIFYDDSVIIILFLEFDGKTEEFWEIYWAWIQIYCMNWFSSPLSLTCVINIFFFDVFCANGRDALYSIYFVLVLQDILVFNE